MRGRERLQHKAVKFDNTVVVGRSQFNSVKCRDGARIDRIVCSVARRVDYDRFPTVEEMARVILSDYLDHSFLREATRFDPTR